MKISFKKTNNLNLLYFTDNIKNIINQMRNIQ